MTDTTTAGASQNDAPAHNINHQDRGHSMNREELTPTDDERMVIYANSNVTRGKFAAAAVHAALTAVGAHHGGPVIVLGAKPSEIAQRATVIRDAGKTEVEPGTITAGTDFARLTVQGEPTDAQVLAALHAFYGQDERPGYEWRTGLIETMRAALRAAAEAS